MGQVIQKSLSHFFLAGISYEKANSSIRGMFAIDDKAYATILQKAHDNNISELFILSTCNRTEIYGFVRDVAQLIGLLCEETKEGVELFHQLGYVCQGNDAVKHLYCVAAGLDSQILGDYEIVSQIKSAARFAREHHSLGTFTERLINSVLQVSKQIKNETDLSSGTVSVAFAVVQFLKDIRDIQQKKILLLGTGKIGRNTCKNMMSYLNAGNITLINRTQETAEVFAQTHGLKCAPYSELPMHLNEADIILVATNSEKPTVEKNHFTKTHSRIILDLSIPKNVDEDVKLLPENHVIDVDELSQVQDKTLSARRGEIPKAEAIIDEQMKDFLYWHQMRKHAVLLQAVKKKMEIIHSTEIKYQKGFDTLKQEDLEEVSSRIIQKMVNMFAGKLRHANGQAENYLQVLGDIFETPVKE